MEATLISDHREIAVSFHNEGLQLDLYSQLKDLLSPLTTDTSKYPFISNIYRHWPSVCIEVSYKCPDNHEHKISINLTFAIEISDNALVQSVQERIQTRLGQMSEPFLNYAEKQTRVKLTFIQKQKNIWVLSTDPFDIQIFDELERNLTPNIRSLFRCLIQLLRHYLPSVVKRNKRSLSGFHVSPLVSSDCIKSLLFNEVLRYPERVKWEGEEAMDRVLGVINSMVVCVNDKNVNPTLQRWPVCKDIINGCQTGSLVQRELFNHPCGVLKALTRLKSHLTQKVKPELSKNSPLKPYLMGGGKLNYITELSVDICLPVDVYFYSFPKHDHPKLDLFTVYLNEMLRHNSGVDLEQIHAHQLKWFWGLVYCKHINCDFTQTSLQSVDRLRNICNSDWDIWEMFISGSIHSSPHSDLVSYLDTASRLEKELILDWALGKCCADDLYSELGAANTEWLKIGSGFDKSMAVYQVVIRLI